MPAHEVEAGRSAVEDHPWPQSELEASLGYFRLCVKKTKQQKLKKGNVWVGTGEPGTLQPGERREPWVPRHTPAVMCELGRAVESTGPSQRLFPGLLASVNSAPGSHTKLSADRNPQRWLTLYHERRQSLSPNPETSVPPPHTSVYNSSSVIQQISPSYSSQRSPTSVCPPPLNSSPHHGDATPRISHSLLSRRLRIHD